ncbi:MAG: sigma-70 family RNA polymerase sigma factor [Sedimentisphaerales bacterium]|nr:sigma-70 family RNA polymerase sigma factor [Sedimentisphaerales bacterium]
MSDKSFENLVNVHSRQVLNTALRVLGDANLAQDVHQEVFLAVWRRWNSYNGSVKWPAYLYRATIRKALAAARTRPQGEDRNGECRPERADTSAPPDGRLAADELQQKLGAALAKLPDRQADAFILMRLEGLDAGGAADVLGCSPETARVHLHRALRRLNRELHEYLQPCGRVKP